MNKYAVAHFNGYTGELLQEIVEADSRLEAIVSYMQWLPDDVPDLESAYRIAADQEQMVSAIKIYPLSKTLGPAVEGGGLQIRIS